MLRELGERVHCRHGADNCPRATIQVFFAECPPSDGEEHCSTIAAISLIVLRRSSCTSHRIISTFLGVELVEGRPDLSLSSSDVLPLLKRACHSKHVARHMASFPYAHHNILKVSTPDLQSLTQNLMLARCFSFTSMLKSQM
jgi:hypothetical protein